MDGGTKRSGTRAHVHDLAAEKRAKLAEDKGVVDTVSDLPVGAEVGELGVDGTAKEGTLEARSVHLHLDGGVDAGRSQYWFSVSSSVVRNAPVEDTRNSGEEVRLHNGGVLQELESVTSREADGAVTVHDKDLEETLIAATESVVVP